MKKIIFIGGVSYSGTTLLDMILSNDINGFSCGELSSLFYKRQHHHNKYKCGCGNPDCKIWDDVISNGKSKIYETIFKMFPNISFIVDSSKDPMWINEQSNILYRTNIQVKNILIYKKPIESAYSFQKRGRFNLFESSWVNYHRLYFTLVKNYFTIKYSDLVLNNDILKQICNDIQIPYFHNKLKYWQKTHHTLFGNTSAKIHLLKKDDDGFDEYRTELEKLGKDKKSIEKEYKQIYYQKINDIKLSNCINNIYKMNIIFQLIDKYLDTKQLKFSHQGKEYCDDNLNLKQLQLSRFQLKFREAKRAFRVNKYKILSCLTNSIFTATFFSPEFFNEHIKRH